MAKKSENSPKKKPGQKPGAVQKKPASVADLKNLSLELSGYAKSIDSAAKRMEKAGVESIVIKGHAMLLRAINSVKNFSVECDGSTVRLKYAVKDREGD